MKYVYETETVTVHAYDQEEAEDTAQAEANMSDGTAPDEVEVLESYPEAEEA